jgi:hypothetical protein
MGGLAACGDSAGPEAGVTAEDLQQLEDDLGALEERVGVLEEPVAGDEPLEDGAPAFEDEAGVFEDPEPLIGQEVTVSAEVSEVMTTGDVGAAYQIAGESGDPIGVIMATPPTELDTNDAVRVSGVVVRVQEDSFEEDFGVAADELFDDPDAFFTDFEGEIAIAADRMEVLQEQAES